MKRRYVWDKATKQLVEVSAGKPRALHFIQDDLPGYDSPIDGKWIEGRKQRREDLKRSNCRPWEGKEAELKEAARKRAAYEVKLDHLAEKMAHRAWAEAPERIRKVFRYK